MHEASPRQESGSRNQDPFNPITQKSGCHSAEIDWYSDDPFNDEVYRKQQEKHCSKRERGKNAGKKRGSQQTAAPSREIGSQRTKKWKGRKPRCVKKNPVRAAPNEARLEPKLLQRYQKNVESIIVSNPGSTADARVSAWVVSSSLR